MERALQLRAWLLRKSPEWSVRSVRQWVQTPVYDFDALAPGQEIAGTAIVDTGTTTIVPRRNDRASTTPFRSLNIAAGPL